MPASFLDRLAQQPLLADGAMGTMLYSRGMNFDRCFDELNLAQPDVVAAVHRAYVDAGADVIETNTFGANRFKLTEHSLQDKVAEINAAAVRLARRVVEASFRPLLVAGSVGPLGVRLAPLGRVKKEEAQAAFQEQIAALAQAGADLIILETFSDLQELTVAVMAAREVCDLPLVAQCTFTRDDRTLTGETPQMVAHTLVEAKVDVVGVNCSAGPAQVLRLLQAMHEAVPTATLSAMPNAGFPEQVGGRILYAATPEYFGDYAAAFVQTSCRLIGGCCGTTPEHIRVMRQALDSPKRGHTVARIVRTSKASQEEGRAFQQPTRLAQALADGRFVITVEMDPPRGYNADRLVEGAAMLHEAGATFINVADSPMSRMRMSPWAACHLIQERLGVETILHFPTRGRNLLRVQGDLLAAHALGVRNLFVVMGDPTHIGDYPEAADNYDVVPSGLIQLIKHGLNAGQDQAGNSIGQPTSFTVGCALNLGAPDVDRELKVLRRKMEAGADFALTQPLYDPELARRFKARYEELYGPWTLPVLVGILPLNNPRHARFLHNEVPGITIPDALLRRMEEANDGPAEGVRIASELLAEIRGFAAGVYLMPAFGRYDLAADVIEAIVREPIAA